MKVVNLKGQASFETIFIFLIILTTAIYISGLYLQTNDTTVAEIITRTQVNEQAILLNEKIIIQSITFTQNSNPPKIEITVLAQNPTKVIINTNKIREEIAKNTKFTDITITTNIKQL